MSEVPHQFRRVRPNIHWVWLRKIYPDWKQADYLDLSISPTLVWFVHDLLPDELSPKTAFLPQFFARLATMIAEGPKPDASEVLFAFQTLSVIVDEEKQLGVTLSIGVRFDDDGAAYATCSADWMEDSSVE